MSEDENKTIIRFVVILVIVLIICVGIYFATKFLVNKDNPTEENTTKEVEINNSVAIVGTMLKKNEDNYYVILYNSKSDKVNEYKSLISTYNKSKKLSLYTVDLGNALNNRYYSETDTNPISNNIQDLKYGDITLIKVNNGTITNAYESIETIKKELKLD